MLFSFVSKSIADTITIVADPWCPYNCTPNTADPGYGIAIATKIFKKAGHDVKYSNVNWTRAIKLTRSGKYNAIISAYKEDAPDFIFPIEEFGISTNAFFVKKGNSWQYKGVNSLKGHKTGIIKDYAYGETLDNYFKTNKQNVDFTTGDDALNLNMKKLLKGRIEILVEDPNVFFLTAKKMGVSDKFDRAGNSGAGDNLYIAFSPKIQKSKEYADILSKGIAEMKQSGELVEILNKYGLEYWK